ncbi:hypothetical protein TSUD_350330 [Trifolium subterraneum]|uniref:Aminotransferase-like plant mobile domain-containing protein n=1 Tax=Trifolium subterraneum TaxID=3900 RepID=A0A2Z6PEQ3_TRISU|nr:hypothetical protein TSUD_350330 [Trifolium subterraneum]
MPYMKEMEREGGMSGLRQMGYPFLDPPFSTFAERWYRETSDFHMPTGKMPVTLDDVSRLLHLPIKGRLLDHTSIPTKSEGMELMMGQQRRKLCMRLNTTKGSYARAYMLLLVGTIIFSNKAKNNVDLTYLKYFRELDQVHTYAWGTAALAFLYRELDVKIKVFYDVMWLF